MEIRENPLSERWKWWPWEHLIPGKVLLGTWGGQFIFRCCFTFRNLKLVSVVSRWHKNGCWEATDLEHGDCSSSQQGRMRGEKGDQMSSETPLLSLHVRSNLWYCCIPQTKGLVMLKGAECSGFPKGQSCFKPRFNLVATFCHIQETVIEDFCTENMKYQFLQELNDNMRQVTRY